MASQAKALPPSPRARWPFDGIPDGRDADGGNLSFLHRIDIALSMPFFTLEVGILEYFLSTLGTWFGVFLFSLGIAPLSIVAFFPYHPLVLRIWVPLTILFVLWFLHLTYESSCMERTKQEHGSQSAIDVNLRRDFLDDRKGFATAYAPGGNK